MTLPLAGIKVLELTVFQQGPVAGAMLADMGADVIKIEDPQRGDPGRGLVWRSDNSLLNTYFECHNRNKRGLSLDLKKEQGREVFHKLLASADVFLHNLRPGVIEGWGLDYKNLSGKYPRLVYASGNGFGGQGPDTDKPSFDIIAQGRGGMLSVTGEPGQPPPLIQVIGAADWVGGVILAYGIMSALFERERSGTGQEVEVSLLGSQVAFGQLALQRFLFSGKSPGKLSRNRVANPLWNTYQASDGKWLIVAALQADRHWANFCKVLDLEHVRDDARFNCIATRREHAPEIISILDEAFRRKDCAAWIKALEAVDIPCGPVNNYQDLANDPQMAANSYILDYEHPTAGHIKMVGNPVRLSKESPGIRMGAPELGQHKEEILLESGFSWGEIAKLAEQDII
ncbi:MAG: CoA transferase [Chloroflexi bacterium]|nr:CoA transferase [Chloroflexota bacterium]